MAVAPWQDVAGMKRRRMRLLRLATAVDARADRKRGKRRVDGSPRRYDGLVAHAGRLRSEAAELEARLLSSWRG